MSTNRITKQQKPLIKKHPTTYPTSHPPCLSLKPPSIPRALQVIKPTILHTELELLPRVRPPLGRGRRRATQTIRPDQFLRRERRVVRRVLAGEIAVGGALVYHLELLPHRLEVVE